MKLLSVIFWATAGLAGLQMSASSPDSIVDRSSMNLSSVPTDLPQTAEYLDLSCNHIHQLHKGDFRNVTLLSLLNVSWNGLELIDAETFVDTPHLKHLDLSHNTLKNLSGQRYLLHTGNLVVLNLAWNKFLNMTLGMEFTFLVKLKNLTLGAKSILVGDFKNVVGVKLQSLSLSLEEEHDYEEGSLMDVHAQSLNIHFSKGKIIHSDLIADALSLFVDVELKNLTGGYKNLTKQLSEVAEIRTTRLSLNSIQIIWKDLTECVNAVLRTSISHMSTDEFAITEPPIFDTKVTETSTMKSFTVRQGVVKSFFFSQEAVYNFFINMPVKYLTVAETSIIHMTCPKKQSPILELDFSYCALYDSIFSRLEGQKTIECETLSNLTTLSLLSNNLKNLQLLSKRLKYMVSLQQLDLSVNSLLYDGVSECLWPPNIRVMNISSGGLTDSIFNCLPNGVEILDLQNNQISVVPPIIYQLKNLVSLNLNANRLRDLPSCDNFPVLTEILLKSNSLHAPSRSKLESCSNLKTLDASLNPFACTCALRDFISFGIKAENKSGHMGIKLLSWPHGYYCFYPETLRDSMLKGFWISEISCNTSLLAVTILVPVVVLIITVFFLCQHLDVPWYMGMIWQWTRAKHRARMRQVRPEDLMSVEYHAFVSYSQHDGDWVKNCLIPNLEGPAGGLRICHHEKNFVPGKSIVENIINCVEKSRCSVFVLSAHFIKSEWCHYELYFASHQRLSLDSDNIVLVLLEPLPQYLIPSKYYQLKAMMNRHTYLEWPQDRAKHRLFWANLRAALQADLPNELVSELSE
ncbi:toll-like receptor 1 [Nematolebias whitei]|uniref:toll-like receptor 1 n=1 Tax=Nematolebias whitei TaxID=451745 RepID=UPI00189876E9|nr:toll-like receptor 1 [Nematolebias whitei]